MTTSDNITLATAFAGVTLPRGAASTLLQWMGMQIGHDTEAGAALRDGGIALMETESEPPVRSTSTSRSSSSSS